MKQLDNSDFWAGLFFLVITIAISTFNISFGIPIPVTASLGYTVALILYTVPIVSAIISGTFLIKYLVLLVVRKKDISNEIVERKT
jgi:hypothetical protein